MQDFNGQGRTSAMSSPHTYDSRADRLAHARHQLVELAGPRRADQCVDERGQLVLGRDHDAGPFSNSIGLVP